MQSLLLAMWPLLALASANYPVFENANQLKELRIPADVHIGSVIYRLRASDTDHDYPLQFDATDYGSYVVRVENLPCSANSTLCEANIYLDRVLMDGQVFKFRFTVRDTKGDTTTASASIQVTDAPVDITAIFPHLPGIIVLPESTKVGTELEYVIVRTHPEHKKAAFLEIRGSPVVDFSKIRNSQETTTGVIALKRSLDFEVQNMYKLQIFAMDMFTDKLIDSRNIASFEIILIVEDVQDTPPTFTRFEPTVKLESNLTQGDVITKVTAIDGDKGNPRQIRYGLVSENNPFTIFFNIDRITGQISLAKPLKQLMAIARSHQPILLTVVAEEEKSASHDVSASTTAAIVLLMAEAGNTAPYFDNDHYVCHLNENSPQGTTIVFGDAYSTLVHDDNAGKQGVFSLILDQNNGTFEISPNVVERKAFFTIRVRNKLLLDYEIRKSVHFVIVARELDPGSLSSSATVLVYLKDVNDNHPQFQQSIYTASVAENATANTFIANVKAVDADTGSAGVVHYPCILGFRNSSLILNAVSGSISIATDNHGFDREEASEYHMSVEARDKEGSGLLATVPLVIRILDVNDETPHFDELQYQFMLTTDLKNFSVRSFIKATDKDAEAPNNVVQYEIISGNYDNKFALDAKTGEFGIRSMEPSLGTRGQRERRQITYPATNNVYTLTVRAYDLGVPHRWTTAQVRISPPDTGSRRLQFMLPASGFNYASTEELLMQMTGGHVTILEIRSADNRRYARAASDYSDRPHMTEKSIVVARVSYGDDSVVDVERVYHLLQPVFRNSVQQSKEELHTAGYGMKSYWILSIVLLSLLILLIVFLLCYLWKCFPTTNGFGKTKKTSQVMPESKTAINFHSRGVQVNNKKQRQQQWQHLEMNSCGSDSNGGEEDGIGARDGGTDQNRKFYNSRRRVDEGLESGARGQLQAQPILLIPNNVSVPPNSRFRRGNDVSAFVLAGNRTSHADPVAADQRANLYIQEIAESEYGVLDPAKLHNRRRRFDQQFNLESREHDGQIQASTSSPTVVRNTTPDHQAEAYRKEGHAEIWQLRTEESLLGTAALYANPFGGKLQNGCLNVASGDNHWPDSRQAELSELVDDRLVDISSLRPSNFAKEHQPTTTHLASGSNSHADKMEEGGGSDTEANTTATAIAIPLVSETDALLQKRKVGAATDEKNKDDGLARWSGDGEGTWQNGSVDTRHCAMVTTDDGSLQLYQINAVPCPASLRCSTAATPPYKTGELLQANRGSVAEHSRDDEPLITAAGVPTDPPLDWLCITEATNDANSAKTDANVDHTKDGVTGLVNDAFAIDRIEVDHAAEAPQQWDMPATRWPPKEDEQWLPNPCYGDDTLSLPGSLSMATQTDRHRATQTDMLCLLRPEPRRAKSENDDSSDSDLDGGNVRRYKTRHKIRTPIMEECENGEGLRNVATSTVVKGVANFGPAHHHYARIGKGTIHSVADSTAVAKHQISATVTAATHARKSVSLSAIDAGHLLTDKEIYTPRMLRSRIVARRSSTSAERCQGNGTDQQKVATNRPSWKADAEKWGLVTWQSQRTNEPQPGDVDPDTTMLRLKGKNQQLMEKKSVFTIAYDDATTEQLEASSNGSTRE